MTLVIDQLNDFDHEEVPKIFSKTEMAPKDDDFLLVHHWRYPLQHTGIEPERHCQSLLPATR